MSVQNQTEHLEMRCLLTTIDLASLGTGGVTLNGVNLDDQSGFSVSNAGDVNGDGFDDVLIGARDADGSGNLKPNAGETYLVFGRQSFSSSIELSSLGSAGVTIFGVDSGDESGTSISNAGDVNGDGFDDLLCGASQGDGSGTYKSSAGETYLIFGAGSLPSTISLANLGAGGVKIFGTDALDSSGCSVSTAGDMNGDGYDDIIIGAKFGGGANNSKSFAGESYVIF